MEPVELLISHEVPYSQWQKIAFGFTDLEHQGYIIIAGYISKYLFLFQHSKLVAITHFTELFLLKGSSQEVFMDNEQPVNSREQSQFSERNRLKHKQPAHINPHQIVNRDVKNTLNIAKATNISNQRSNRMLCQIQLPADCLHPQRSYTIGQQAQEASDR